MQLLRLVSKVGMTDSRSKSEETCTAIINVNAAMFNIPVRNFPPYKSGSPICLEILLVGLVDLLVAPSGTDNETHFYFIIVFTIPERF
jgi:hypothetical protein